MARCHTAAISGIANAVGYKIRFWKKSDDGSGKATLIKSANTQDLVRGVLFKIDINDLSNLDAAEGEGMGYNRDGHFTVSTESDEHVSSVAYIADSACCCEQSIPYDWYRDLVLVGARYHQFPDDYLKNLQAVTCGVDPSVRRPRRRDALQLLSRHKAGMCCCAV